MALKPRPETRKRYVIFLKDLRPTDTQRAGMKAARLAELLQGPAFHVSLLSARIPEAYSGWQGGHARDGIPNIAFRCPLLPQSGQAAEGGSSGMGLEPT